MEFLWRDSPPFVGGGGGVEKYLIRGVSSGTCGTTFPAATEVWVVEDSWIVQAWHSRECQFQWHAEKQ